MKSLLKHYLVLKISLLFYLFIGFITRMVLLIHPITQSHFHFTDYVKIFIFGLISDFFISIFIGSLFWLYLSFISNSKFQNHMVTTYFRVI